MQKKNTKRARMTQRAAVAALLTFAATSAFALGTGRAAGTPLVEPAQKLDAQTCLSCHTTVKKLHDRGAHKDLNCGSCHTAKAEHMTKPSAANRPTTRFDHESCSQCHQAPMKDLMDPKYHYEWAKRGGNPPYSFIRDNDYGDGWPRYVQYRIPRFHIGLMADFVANRSNGRFEYDDKRGQAEPVYRHWDVITDNYPQNEFKMMGGTVGIGWRAHKGREGQQDSRCLLCKTSETMFEYKYDLTEDNPKGYDFSSPVVPMLKKINTGFNCNFCHDPHSAEPRIIFSPLIESMAGENGKDNFYQKNLGKNKAMTPIEVVDMGMRGFTRKIGILKDYNANFQCGQCHNAANRYLTYNWTKDGKPVTKEDLKKAGISPYSTEFFRNPIESWEFFKKLGWNQGTNGATGVKMVNGSDHPHVEILLGSKHGQAGVTCTDCHFAKKADGTMEHQPSLAKMKVQNTCLRSDCHGKGTKDNWSEGQALYTIEAIQQEYRIRTQKMEMDAYVSRGLLADVKAGKIVIPEKEMQQLNDAYERYLATRDWYFTDLSTGFHDPDGFNASATKVIWDLRMANTAAKKAMKPVAQKTASTK